MSGILPKHVTNGPYHLTGDAQSKVCVDVCFHRTDLSVWVSASRPNVCFPIWDTTMAKPIPMQPKLWASLVVESV